MTTSRRAAVDTVSGRTDRATLATIASVAGVSVATVSKVVNDRPDVAATTRARVRTLLEQHDYVARRGDPVPTNTVELMYHGRMNAYSVDIMQGVLDAAAEHEVDVVVTRLPAEHELRRADLTQWVGRHTGTRRRAVIAVASRMARELTQLARADVPVVVVDPLEPPDARVISVGVTNFSGGLAATEHLLGLGHRRIAYAGGPEIAVSNRARLAGYRAALEAAGVRVPKGYVQQCGEFCFETGLAAGGNLFDLPQPPTAVFAGNDEIGLGLFEAARERGLRIPQDVSVIGFDNADNARLASPPLTTIAQPLRQMGAVALRSALRLAAGQHLDSHHVELAAELIVRSSTAPLSA